MNRTSVITRRGTRGYSNGVLGIFALFTLAAAGFVWVSLGVVAEDRWPIRWLEINGNFQRVSAEQVRARLSPHIRSSFFTIDLHRLRDLAGDISWVSAVEVQKRWPDTVVVEVSEYQPFAHWNSGQLISSMGEPFEVPGADDIQGLPWLSGPDSQLETVLDHWTRFNETLAPAGLLIQRLEVDPRGAWTMRLDSGTEINMGRRNMLSRLQRLMASWESLLAGKATPPGVIDLRYTNGFAVSWLPETEQLAGNGL